MNEDCFYCYLQRNNVVVLFGNLKVQSFGLTEVSDCCLLIVVTSSTFLKRNIWMIFAKKVGGVGPWKKEEVKMGWGDELLCLNKCYDMNETSSQTGTMLFSQYHNRLFIPQLFKPSIFHCIKFFGEPFDNDGVTHVWQLNNGGGGENISTKAVSWKVDRNTKIVHPKKQAKSTSLGGMFETQELYTQEHFTHATTYTHLLLFIGYWNVKNVWIRTYFGLAMWSFSRHLALSRHGVKFAIFYIVHPNCIKKRL